MTEGGGAEGPGVWIYLTDEQMERGREHGELVAQESRRRGLKDRYGYDGGPQKSLTQDIQCALSEIAAAQALGVQWNATVNAPKGDPDIGENTQVRWRSKPWMDLLIRPDDRDDQIFVLVVGDAPALRVVGWCWGYEGKQEAFLKDLGNDRPPCYLIPGVMLNTIPGHTPEGTPQEEPEEDVVLDMPDEVKASEMYEWYLTHEDEWLPPELRG